jgi:hypothetical protein
LNFGNISSSEPRESHDIKNEHNQFGRREKAAIKLMEQDALKLLQILFFGLYKDKPNAILKVSCRYLSGGGPDKILGNFCLERKKVSYLLLFLICLTLIHHMIWSWPFDDNLSQAQFLSNLHTSLFLSSFFYYSSPLFSSKLTSEKHFLRHQRISWSFMIEN